MWLWITGNSRTTGQRQSRRPWEDSSVADEGRSGKPWADGLEAWLTGRGRGKGRTAQEGGDEGRCTPGGGDGGMSTKRSSKGTTVKAGQRWWAATRSVSLWRLMAMLGSSWRQRRKATEKASPLWRSSRRATAKVSPLRKPSRRAMAETGPLRKKSWRMTRQTEP